MPGARVCAAGGYPAGVGFLASESQIEGGSEGKFERKRKREFLRGGEREIQLCVCVFVCVCVQAVALMCVSTLVILFRHFRVNPSRCGRPSPFKSNQSESVWFQVPSACWPRPARRLRISESIRVQARVVLHCAARPAGRRYLSLGQRKLPGRDDRVGDDWWATSHRAVACADRRRRG